MNAQNARRVRRAASVEEAGRLLMQPGTIVEVDRATAEACGADVDDCISWEAALAAAEDPAAFDAPPESGPRPPAPPRPGKIEHLPVQNTRTRP